MKQFHNPRRFHPLTGLPIAPLGRRKDGSPIYPIMGASEDDGGKVDEKKTGDDDGGKVDEKKTGDDDGGKADENDKGFPANTKVEDMTAEQQAAYWRHYARKHEGTAKEYAKLGLTPEQIGKLVEDAKPDSQKTIDAAKAEARKEALAELVSDSVNTIIDTFLAAREAKRDDVPNIDFWDYSKFTNEDGKVDTAKVTTALNAALGKSETPPGDTGQGRRGRAPQSARDAGKAEAERRFKK